MTTEAKKRETIITKVDNLFEKIRDLDIKKIIEEIDDLTLKQKLTEFNDYTENFKHSKSSKNYKKTKGTNGRIEFLTEYSKKHKITYSEAMVQARETWDNFTDEEKQNYNDMATKKNEANGIKPAEKKVKQPKKKKEVSEPAPPVAVDTEVEEISEKEEDVKNILSLENETEEEEEEIRPVIKNKQVPKLVEEIETKNKKKIETKEVVKKEKKKAKN